MKRIAALLLTLAVALCAALPVQSFAAIPDAPTENIYVVDTANVIDGADREEMLALGAALGLTALSMLFSVFLARYNDKLSKSAAAEKKGDDPNG